MFGRQKKLNGFRSERPFSVEFVVELLRAELAKHYGQEVKIFQSVVTSTPAVIRRQERTVTERERGWLSPFEEKFVKIEGLIGPFEWLYPGNPLGDKRRRLRRVEAVGRLINNDNTRSDESIYPHVWRPHFLSFAVEDEFGKVVDRVTLCYEAGTLDDTFYSKNAENPCPEMVSSHTTDFRARSGELTPATRVSHFAAPTSWL